MKTEPTVDGTFLATGLGVTRPIVLEECSRAAAIRAFAEVCSEQQRELNQRNSKERSDAGS